ncbi:VOC family protein [Arenimonas sp.]|uniref:VOC family protein n=1 Tax=Arenimonas sp. TaxID=1872635 RepID=UPI0039E3D6B5
MNLNQITVPVQDVQAAVGFYRRLGLRQIVGSPHYARFESPEGEATFSVHLAERVPADSGVVVYFECAELDDTVRRLLAQGLVFERLPTDEPWLWREARLRDPSGNVVCLYFAGENRRHPPWRLREA